MSLNGIAHLPSRYQRQKAKLELAATNRTADGNPRDTYDITELPTQYANTIVLLKCTSSATMLTNSSEYSITVSNTTGPTFSDTNPFTPSVGGSITFGGTNRYITIPGRTEFAVGLGDFTAEWWQYQTSIGAGTFPRVWTINNWPSASLGVSIENGNCLSWTNGSYVLTTLTSVLNTWTHIAMVRKNGIIKIFQDGAVKNSYANTATITDGTSSMYIGSEAGANEATTKFPGKITNFRFVSGQAMYTNTFTVAKQPLPVIDICNNPNSSGLELGRPWN